MEIDMRTEREIIEKQRLTMMDEKGIKYWACEEVAELIRCKDCKYLYNDDDNDDDCPLRDYFWHNEEDYCSYGERREDNGHNNS